MTTILKVLGTSTPVSEVLAEKLGYVKAAIACRVFFYQQLDDGVCKASTKTLATKLGMSQGAISKNLKWLVDNGYICELGEHKRGNVSNQYAVTDRFYVALQQSTGDEIERSRDERCPVERSPGERYVHEMNVNVHQVNGKEESKESLKETTTTTADEEKSANLEQIRELCQQHFADPQADESFRDDLIEQLATHGARAVLDAINLALSPDRANGRPKSWGYIKGILNNPDRPKRVKGIKNGRNNTSDEEVPEWARKYIELLGGDGD